MSASLDKIYEEIMEVVDKLPISERSREFLEDVGTLAEEMGLDGNLSVAQEQWLRDIYDVACRSPY